jgi:hypothetical protein
LDKGNFNNKTNLSCRLAKTITLHPACTDHKRYQYWLIAPKWPFWWHKQIATLIYVANCLKIIKIFLLKIILIYSKYFIFKASFNEPFVWSLPGALREQAASAGEHVSGAVFGASTGERRCAAVLVLPRPGTRNT